MDLLEYVFVSKENKGPYHRLFVELPDPRVTSYPLMDSPLWVLGILILYWLFVNIIGPKLMNNRKPMDLKYSIIVYNVFQIVASSYIVYEGLSTSIHRNYKWHCDEMDYSDSPRSLKMLKIFYFYTLMKLVELSDTVFFVLRKKFNQITVLHIYHHSAMALTTWVCALYYGGGMLYFPIVLNSFVHIIMYGYYFLASLGPGLQKYLWWKKHLTLIQIMQLSYALIKWSAGLIIGCKQPKFPIYASMLNISIQLVLFINFYVQSYKKNNRKPQDNKDKQF